MKLVTFSRAMAPHVAGETRVVPDEVAAQLAKDGDAEVSGFPPSGLGPAAPRRGYKTRSQK